MKYKVGDKVKIKSLDWYNKNKDEDGEVCVYGDSYAIFIQVMTKFCGQTVTISEVVDDLYGILEDGGDYSWADYMIECLIEPAIENKPQEKMVSLDKVCDILHDMLHDQWINDAEMVGTWAYYNMEEFMEDFCKKLEE